MNLVYIHGNHATADSFNFIRSKLPGHNDILLEYDSGHGFYTHHAPMLDRLHGLDDVFFDAHSLGGIHALHLAHHVGQELRLADGASEPSFSPNGKYIMYATKGGGRTGLAVVSVDGKVKQRLTTQAGNIREPNWGPFMK